MGKENSAGRFVSGILVVQAEAGGSELEASLKLQSESEAKKLTVLRCSRYSILIGMHFLRLFFYFFFGEWLLKLLFY